MTNPGFVLGNGPWRISPECPSDIHNSQRALRGAATRKTCICPRAQELRDWQNLSRAQRAERSKQRVARGEISPGRLGAAARRAAWRAERPLYEIGNGPWVVLVDCPAPMHNSSSALPMKCVCPRARALKRDYQEAENERKRAKKARAARRLVTPPPPALAARLAKPGRRTDTPTYFANILGSFPSLPGAACANGFAYRLFDSAREQDSGVNLTAAKTVCETCPALAACRAAVLRLEEPAGDWGGVYGGLSMKERREVRSGVRPVMERG